MRVTVSKAAQQDAALVGSAIAVGILKEQELSVLSDIKTAFTPLQPSGDVETVGKNMRLVRPAVMVGIFEADNLVVRQVAREDMWIGGCDGHVHPAGWIPADG